MESLLRRLLGERISAEVPLQLTPLVGDASTRRYSRLRAGDTPFIVMELGERGGAEEYGSLPDDPGEPAFLAVQQHLAQAGLPVPELYGYDGEARVLVLEDLGDVTLAARSQATSLEAARPRVLYRTHAEHTPRRAPHRHPILCFSRRRRSGGSLLSSPLCHRTPTSLLSL